MCSFEEEKGRESTAEDGAAAAVPYVRVEATAATAVIAAARDELQEGNCKLEAYEGVYRS